MKVTQVNNYYDNDPIQKMSPNVKKYFLRNAKKLNSSINKGFVKYLQSEKDKSNSLNRSTKNEINIVKDKTTSEMQKYFPGLFKGEVSTSRFAPVKNVAEEIARDPEKKRLYDAAVEFQAIFINMMLKSMRSNLNKKDDFLYGGFRQEIFEDMLYDEYAKLMSTRSNFNLAEQIYRQLEPGLGSTNIQNKVRAARSYTRNLNLPSSSLPGSEKK